MTWGNVYHVFSKASCALLLRCVSVEFCVSVESRVSVESCGGVGFLYTPSTLFLASAFLVRFSEGAKHYI